MLEILKIKIFGIQPAAKVTDNMLERLIQRDFGDQALNVKLKLSRIDGDTHNGKNRISAAIIKLSKKDIKAIDYLLEMSKNDYRELIAQAEYPRCSKLAFDKMEERDMKRIYLNDWIDYCKWIHQ